MLEDLIHEAKLFGLEVHMDKTKILQNGVGRATSATSLDICGKQFEVLGSESSTMYLGRMLCLRNDMTHDVELKNRMAKGWAKFAVYRDELTNRQYSLKQCLRVFISVIQPSVLYGCVSWTMTTARVANLRATQRRMLRKVVGTKRRIQLDEDGAEVLESYVEWIQRATRKVEDLMLLYDVPDWVEESCRRKYRWAGHVCRRTDGRWTTQVLKMQPIGFRRSGRPITRWSYTLNKFFGEVSESVGEQRDWMSMAADRDEWKQFEEVFVQFFKRR